MHGCCTKVIISLCFCSASRLKLACSANELLAKGSHSSMSNTVAHETSLVRVVNTRAGLCFGCFYKLWYLSALLSCAEQWSELSQPDTRVTPHAALLYSALGYPDVRIRFIKIWSFDWMTDKKKKLVIVWCLQHFVFVLRAMSSR